MLVLGARPQFIKSAPVIKEFLSRSRHFELSIVHSGQHYDPEMSAIFFRELHIPRPSANLHVGSGSHATQTARIMQCLERSILKGKPNIVAAVGDTNTTLATALCAAKLNVPVAHIEAGLRSHDSTMPEEINRRLTDHCSAWLFAPTRTAVKNLRKEGLIRMSHFVGDTTVDVLRAMMPIVRSREEDILKRFGLQSDEYVLVTLHRPSNVDNLERLREVYRALCNTAKVLRVLFLVHPRTRTRLTQLTHHGDENGSPLTLASAQGYIESLALLTRASCLLTDSGGMQKEAFLLHVPCITLRNNTEWPETLHNGANRLVKQPQGILREIVSVSQDEELRTRIARLKNPFGDGHASSRIVNVLERSLASVK
jgi:UDP-N-acetylglucosamine 2-epimerase